jgi:lipopolysaccharide/colanic/teichoic acid biosynthesis glycosyltransferase
MSLVGPTPGRTAASRNGSSPYPSYWGKPGLTGLLQVNYHEDLTAGEIEKYTLYYAKNQSLMLDIEILLKSLITNRKR